MKYILGALVDCVEVLKHSKSLLVLYLLFALLPFVGSLDFVPFVLKLILMLISIGWFVARFIYVEKSLKNKKLEYKNLFKNVLVGIKKMLPIVIVMLLITLIPVFILLLWYGRWFSTSYLNGGLGLTTQQVFVNLVHALSNGDLWEEFFGQNIFMRAFYQGFLFLILTGILVGKLTAIFISVQKFSTQDSVLKAFYYLSEHIALLFSFVVIHIILNLIIRIILMFFTVTFEAMLPQIRPLFILTLTSFAWLFLDVFVMSYFNKTIHSTSLSNKVMRWFRAVRN